MCMWGGVLDLYFGHSGLLRVSFVQIILLGNVARNNNDRIIYPAKHNNTTILDTEKEK